MSHGLFLFSDWEGSSKDTQTEKTKPKSVSFKYEHSLPWSLEPRFVTLILTIPRLPFINVLCHENFHYPNTKRSIPVYSWGFKGCVLVRKIFTCSEGNSMRWHQEVQCISFFLLHFWEM